MKAWKIPSKTPESLGFQGLAPGQGRVHDGVDAGWRRRRHHHRPGAGAPMGRREGLSYPAGRKRLDAMVNVPARRRADAVLRQSRRLCQGVPLA